MNKWWWVASLVVVGLAVGAGVVWKMTSHVSEPTRSELEVAPVPMAKVRLKILSGSVTVNGQPAGDGEINVGDEIAADGRVELVYPNGSQTRLDRGAKMVLKEFVDRPYTAKVELKQGRIWNRLVKLVAGESYQSESSTVVATVRGTSYGHGILPDGTNRVVTTSGEVEGNCNNGSQQGDVKAGSQVFMNCQAGEKIKEQVLVNKDLEDEWLKFNADEDKKQEEEIGKDKFGEEAVLGLSTENEPTATPTPSPKPVAAAVPLIECVGPDGVHFKATKVNCDNLNEFWRLHTPSNPNPNGTGSSSGSNSSDQPTATLTPTPTPTNFLSKVVLNQSLLELSTGGLPTTLTATVYDVNNQVVSGAAFAWTMTPAQGMGDLVSSGETAQFSPTGRGSGQISVTASLAAESVSTSIPVTVGSGMTGVQQVAGCVPQDGDCLTLQVDGFGLTTPGLQVVIVDPAGFEKSGFVVGQPTSTQMIVEFQFLISCVTFDVKLKDAGQQVLDVKTGAAATQCPPQITPNVQPAAYDGTGATCAQTTFEAVVTDSLGVQAVDVHYFIYDAAGALITDSGVLPMPSVMTDTYQTTVASPVIPLTGWLVWTISAQNVMGATSSTGGSILDISSPSVGCN